MRFILYARASTKDKQHPEHQLAELRTEAARRGWTVAAEIIETESGRKDDRPKLQAALDNILSGAADGLAAVELTRIGRSLQHLIKISKALNAAGRHFACTRQGIDTTTPTGRLIFHVLGAVGEYEAEVIRERVLAGVRHKRAQNGGSWGRQRGAIPLEVLERARGLRSVGVHGPRRSWRDVSSQLYLEGHAQPARDRGRSAHPRRPWPVGTLRDALERVELPPSK